MTRIITLTLSLLLFGAVAQAQFSAEPGIEFAKEMHDFGEIMQHDPTVYHFEFTNTGTEPLILSSVKGSCSCTVPQWPREPIMPGETGEIKVKYDSKRVGPFQKSITIVSNAANANTKVIRIKGNVKAAASN